MAEPIKRWVSMKIGYARVSTRHQKLDLQLKALRAHGCEVIFTDCASGVSNVRKGLAQAQARCHSGDVLVAWRLDRFGRSLLDLLKLSDALKTRGASLHVLTGRATSLDTSCPEGRIIFTMMAALAEYERDLVGERINAGLRAARERGIKLGRPRKRLGSQRTAKAISLTDVWCKCA